jgi:hypothetical protein
VGEDKGRVGKSMGDHQRVSDAGQLYPRIAREGGDDFSYLYITGTHKNQGQDM